MALTVAHPYDSTGRSPVNGKSFQFECKFRNLLMTRAGGGRMAINHFGILSFFDNCKVLKRIKDATVNPCFVTLK